MPAPKLVSTGVAAAALGVAHNTLHQWWLKGIVEPALVTPGGHARRDVDELKEQLRRNRKPEQAD